MDGLDLLGPYGLELAIVPHWNNTEGGTHDTRFCFMGEPRLKHLEARLPDSAVIVGIDEYTALTIDPATRRGRVMGAGQVTVRCKGCELYYPAGSTFSLDEFDLKTQTLPGEVAPTVARPDAISETVEAMLRQLPATWEDWPDALEDDAPHTASFIDLLVWVRSQLRAARQWALADEIRERLLALGIVLENGAAETIWRKE